MPSFGLRLSVVVAVCVNTAAGLNIHLSSEHTSCMMQNEPCSAETCCDGLECNMNSLICVNKNCSSPVINQDWGYSVQPYASQQQPENTTHTTCEEACRNDKTCTAWSFSGPVGMQCVGLQSVCTYFNETRLGSPTHFNLCVFSSGLCASKTYTDPK
jgi:hypothetical protein